MFARNFMVSGLISNLMLHLQMVTNPHVCRTDGFSCPRMQSGPSWAPHHRAPACISMTLRAFPAAIHSLSMACTLALLEKCPGAWNREDVRRTVTAIFSQQLAKSILFEWARINAGFSMQKGSAMTRFCYRPTPSRDPGS
jgi:hypothetical protein